MQNPTPYLRLIKTGGPEPPDEPMLLTFKRKYIVSRAIDPDYSEATVTQDELAINDFISTVGDVWPPTVQHVKAWYYDLRTRISERTGRPLSQATQKSYDRHVTAWLNWLKGEGAISNDPVPPYRSRPKEPPPEPKGLLPAEVDQLMGYLQRQANDPAATVHDLRNYAMILLAVETGMRSGELSHLEWHDIDFPNKRIVIPDEITKANNSGGLAFFDKSKKPLLRLKDELAHQGELQLVFPSLWTRGVGTLQATSISHIFKRIIREAGLRDDLHFHCLRHTAGRIFAEGGMTTTDVAKLLRHKQASTSLRYTEAPISRVETLVRENVFDRRRGGGRGDATPPASIGKPAED